MNNKKGQGISINTMIIVALALLVLIVLAILFGKSIINAQKNTNCIEKQGICKESCGDLKPITEGRCSKSTDSCCDPFRKNE